MSGPAFKECLCKDLTPSMEYVRIVGSIEAGYEDNTMFLNDSTGRVKVTGCPSGIRGYAEIRGKCTGTDSIQFIEMTHFADENFDMSDYVQVLELYKRFPELSA